MKTDLQRSKESLGGNPTKNKSEKNSCWKLSEKSDCCRSTGPVDRQRSDFRPLGSRSTGTVDRSPKQRVSLSVGRPGAITVLSIFPRLTGPVDRQRDLLSGWDCGRPSRSTGFSTVRNLTVDGRPARSTSFSQKVLTNSNSYIFLTGFVLVSPQRLF